MLLGVMMLCGLIAPVLRAQNSNPAPASAVAAAPASPSETRPVQLSRGVPEILKLARAHVGDEVIIGFIRNSGRPYRLSASEILYLREQGVSEPVLSAMLTLQPNMAATGAPGTNQPAPGYVEGAPAYAQPVPGYGYAVPYYYDYGYWPYYYWGYPAWGFGFGYGGRYYGGYRWGGYHGGYYGGGYHGGGSHGGGGHR